MEIKYTLDYQVRFYECDAIGHLNNAVYVKYMHDAANQASRAVGLDREDYMKINRSWLVRETKIEYFAPLQYGDSVRITTWVEDMHRVRSLRIYEFENIKSGELIARGETDWVFMNTETGVPTKIPPDIKMAYIGTDSFSARPIGRKFPKTPPEAKDVFKVLRSVEWRDLDPLGHVNNAAYLSYIEDCGFKVAQAYGWPWKRMSEHNFAIVARRHHIEYRQPAFMDEILEISTWVSSVRRSTGTRHYVIRRPTDGKVIAVCHSMYVWVDINTLKPIRIPDVFLNAFRNNIIVTPKGGN